MPYRFWDAARWFNGTLCCRYVVVQAGSLRVPTWNDGVMVASEWHWALGLFTDGRFEVLGAWRGGGAATAAQIAQDLHDRGIDRIKALAANGWQIAAMARFHPKMCRSSAAELAESGAFGPRMRRAIRWTDAAAQRLQARMQRAVQKQAPFTNAAAAADFIAQAFQRADRDLLDDRWDRARPAPYGASASAAALALPR